MRRAVLLFVLPLAACQTSMATRPMPSSPTKALVGAPYAIPALRYDLTILRTLTDCEPVDPPGPASNGTPQSSLNLEFETEATSSAGQVTGERYVVDYRALSSWSKSTAFKIVLNENQTLKSFNAEADDQGPEIAAGLVKTGFTVARMIAGLPVAALPARGAVAPPPPPATCPKAVQHVADLSEAMEGQTKALKEKTAELDGLLVTQFVGTLSDAEKARAATLRTEIRGLAKSTADMQKKIDGWKKDLSFTETATIDPGGAPPAAITFPSGDPAMAARQTTWLKSLFGPDVDEATLAYAKARLGFIVPTVTVVPGAAVGCANLGLADSCQSHDAPKWPPEKASAKPESAPGLVFRMPVQTALRVCHEILEAPTDARPVPSPLRQAAVVRAGCEARDPTVKLLVADSAAAAQLGPQVVLPLTNGFGQNNKLEATFRADGSVETVAYDGKGVGTRLASLIGSAADQAAAYQGAEQDDRKARADAAASAATDALDEQIAVAKKEKELADARAALEPDPSAAARQAQAELDAKVARLEAEKKIKELEAALQS